jgi:hypothetical protein
MPLEKGDNPEAIKHNIEAEKAAGKPTKQAVAIALHTAKDSLLANMPTTVSQAESLEKNKQYWKQYACHPPGMGEDDFV